jgi:TonB-linked SusC/RagA family outer membrane protein
MNKSIIITLLSFVLICSNAVMMKTYAQANYVSGVIKDEKGETLIGVSILVKGSKSATVSDIDGKFSIPASPKSTLAFSYVGFITKELQLVEGQNKYIIILAENAKSLDEVVVVGYGTQRKQTVTGSISTVKSAELTDIPVSNLNSALTGKLPGLITLQPSGRPGEDVASIYVRGLSTWVDASPLIIVDGVERESFSQINANEVETISVLKDASSTAVYGVRGANGVILITTKRGTEGKPKVSLSVNYGLQTPTKIPQFLGSYDHLLLKKQAYINDGQDPLVMAPTLLSDEALEGFRSGLDPYKYPNVNWYNEMTKSSSPEKQYNLNVSGGIKAIKYFVSVGYLDQSGMFKYTDLQKKYNPDTYYRRFNYRSNLDITINKYQTLTTNISGRIEEKNGFPGVSNLIQSLIAKQPYLNPIFNPDGSVSALQGNGNPLTKIAYSGYENTRTNNYDLMGLLHNDLSFITKGLAFDASVSYTSTVGRLKSYTDGVDTYFYSPTTGRYDQITEDSPFSYGGESTSALFRREGIQLKLYYTKTIEKHNFKGTLVYNQQKDFNGISIPSVLMGYAGRVEYAFANKYLAEVNLGYNGSENFAKGHRFGFFPAFSMGYVITEENFMKGLSSVLPYLKIRGSMGLVGNDKIGSNSRFLYQGLYSSVGVSQYYDFGTNNPTSTGGIVESRNENPDLTWEMALKQNIGIDGHLFSGNLLSFSVDFFSENRKNILMTAGSLLQSTGIASPIYNIGEVNNWGYEMELTHRNKIGAFEYFLKGNMSFARNQIVNYDDPGKTPAYQKYAGYRIGQFRGYQVLGFFQSVEEINNSPSQAGLGGPIIPGDLKYLDYNDDKVINDKDIIPIGYSRVPEITYALTPGFSWKGFDFSVMMQGSANSSVYFTSNAGFEFGGGAGGGQVSSIHQDYWTPTNLDAKYPSLHVVTKHSNKNINTFFLKKGDYLRLKTLQVGYSIPKSVCKYLQVEAIRIFASGSNLYTWSALDNFDPEVINQSGEVYPQQTVYNFGINLNF